MVSGERPSWSNAVTVKNLYDTRYSPLPLLMNTTSNAGTMRGLRREGEIQTETEGRMKKRWEEVSYQKLDTLQIYDQWFLSLRDAAVAPHSSLRALRLLPRVTGTLYCHAATRCVWL